MAQQVQNTPRRNWIYILLGGMLVLIAVMVGLRKLVGQSNQEIKAQATNAKEIKELEQKPAGNPDAFLARLREQVEKAEREKTGAAAKATPEVAPASNLQNPSTPSSTNRAPAAGMPATPAPTAKPSAGSNPAGMPSDDDLNQFDALKAQVAKDANRKLGVYESEQSSQARASVVQGAASGLNPSVMAALMGGGSGTGSGANTAAASSTSNANQQLLAEYLRQQQGSAANQQIPQDTRFIQNAASTAKNRADQVPLVAKPGQGRHMLMEGTAINIIMERDVSSELAGPCRARVERNVYDSLTQSIVLIPAATTVICEYNSEVVMGQERMMFAFTRLIYPVSGASVLLADMKAADVGGAIGAPAEVNNRFWRIFGASFMIAWVANRAQALQPSNVTINVNGGSSGSVAAQVLAETSRSILQRYINIRPELRIGKGERLTLIVSRDMQLDPALTQGRGGQ